MSSFEQVTVNTKSADCVSSVILVVDRGCQVQASFRYGSASEDDVPGNALTTKAWRAPIRSGAGWIRHWLQVSRQ